MMDFRSRTFQIAYYLMMNEVIFASTRGFYRRCRCTMFINPRSSTMVGIALTPRVLHSSVGGECPGLASDRSDSAGVRGNSWRGTWNLGLKRQDRD